MPMESKSKSKSPSARQQAVAVCVIGLLMVISAILSVLQGRFDPSDWREQPGSRQSSKSQDLIENEISPDGIAVLSPPERYTARTLSDKIDGKAELYLDAGFRELVSRRFALDTDKNRWMERYVYMMQGHPNAYSVFSLQRRQNMTPTDITDNAYFASNGLFFVHGRYYIEIISAEHSPAMQDAMKMLGVAFVDAHEVIPETLSVLNLFPDEHRVRHTETLIAKSAFGLELLDWVYTAEYAQGDQRATAFIMATASAAQAAELAGTFIEYWREYGGEMIQTPPRLSNSRVISILDAFEIAAVRGPYLFGVHEATALDFGAPLTERLQHAIGAMSHETR